jgi:hypothetical protein
MVAAPCRVLPGEGSWPHLSPDLARIEAALCRIKGHHAASEATVTAARPLEGCT